MSRVGQRGPITIGGAPSGCVEGGATGAATCWTCLSCDEPNRWHRLQCNNCAGFRPRSATEQHAETKNLAPLALGRAASSRVRDARDDVEPSAARAPACITAPNPVTVQKKFDAGPSRHFTVNMRSQGITDANAAQVGREGLDFIASQGVASAEVVDFSRNSLSARGVYTLLSIFADSRIPIRILMLHHNNLDFGGTIASFLQQSGGTMRELHLSHNQLDIDACWEIIEAAALSVDGHGRFNYPGPSRQPLWLRLEHNKGVTARPLIHRLKSQEDRFCRPAGRVVRQVYPGECGPRSCMCRGGPPAIHLSCDPEIEKGVCRSDVRRAPSRSDAYRASRPLRPQRRPKQTEEGDGWASW